MDEMGGALLTHIEEVDRPCSLEDLSSLTGVKKYSTDTVKQALKNLCCIGVIVQIPGGDYISAEKDLLASRSSEQRSSDRQFQSLPVRTDRPRDCDLAVAAGGFRRSTSEVQTCHHPNARPSLDTQALVQRTQTSQVAVINQNFDCNAQVQDLTEKIKKIMSVLQLGGIPIHASKVAQMSGIGKSKAAVNRELYALKERGFLACDGAKWSLVKTAEDDELRVCAADLAKKPAGKKALNTASGQVTRSGQSSSQGQASDCGCPNKGPSCNHFHLNQTNHYHQTNVQVGNHNQLYFDGNGEKSSSTGS